jgi:hypothetical protein
MRQLSFDCHAGERIHDVSAHNSSLINWIKFVRLSSGARVPLIVVFRELNGALRLAAELAILGFPVSIVVGKVPRV